MAFRFTLPGRIAGFAALAVLISFSSFVAAQSVTITSPAANSTVSGSVHVQAKAVSSNPIKVSKIYVNGVIKYQVASATVDTSLSLSAGTHRLTVWAYDSAGVTMKNTVYVTSTGTSSTTNMTVISRIEEMTGWGTCGNCGNVAGVGEQATYSMTRGISSPSKDGSSSQFSIGGSYPYKNAYWYVRHTAPSTLIQYLKYEFDLYIPKAYATAPQAIEFECQQKIGGYKYNFAWQADYAGKSWRIFDYVNHKWDASGLSFTPFTPDTWHHIIAEYHAEGTTVVHDALTVDGVRKLVGKRHAARPATTGRTFTNAFQLDLNGKATDYKVYVDGMKITLQ